MPLDKLGALPHFCGRGRQSLDAARDPCPEAVAGLSDSRRMTLSLSKGLSNGSGAGSTD